MKDFRPSNQVRCRECCIAKEREERLAKKVHDEETKNARRVRLEQMEERIAMLEKNQSTLVKTNSTLDRTNSSFMKFVNEQKENGEQKVDDLDERLDAIEKDMYKLMRKSRK